MFSYALAQYRCLLFKKPVQTDILNSNNDAKEIKGTLRDGPL